MTSGRPARSCARLRCYYCRGVERRGVSQIHKAAKLAGQGRPGVERSQTCQKGAAARASGWSDEAARLGAGDRPTAHLPSGHLQREGATDGQGRQFR